MLHLNSLTLSNFGPFKGTQSIVFSIDPGVTIFFGENGRGKTTFLNAIRFALFGKIKSRAAQKISLLDLINNESLIEGNTTASVTLNFSYATHAYELTRKILPRHGITSPKSDADLVIEPWLQMDGNILSPEVAKDQLTKIMPEEVSRFFLFDGELLQEYEELIRQETTMGLEIKEAIEQILGVPVLTNARQDLDLLHTQAQRLESKATTRDLKIQEMQGHLRAMLATKEETEKILLSKKNELKEKNSERSEIIEEMRKWERIRGLLDKKDKLTQDVQLITEKVVERKEKLKEALVGSWKTILAPTLVTRKIEIKDKYDQIVKNQIEKSTAESMIEIINTSLGANQCIVCDKPIDSLDRNQLQEKLLRLVDTSHIIIQTTEIKQLEAQISCIENIVSVNRLEIIREFAQDIDDKLIEINDKKGKIEELTNDTRDVKELELQALALQDRTLTGEITLIEQGIEKEQGVLNTTNANITKIQDELTKKGGPDLVKERKQRELCSKLHQLFQKGVDAYREKLRQKVEDAASKIFLGLTNDKDYASLKINESYGLAIVHNSGAIVKVRSAGNEHVVALSLMGALQQNAPLKGPIIMDSPFGRLDTVHKVNVIKMLPEITAQSMLLVYESEIDPTTARNTLAGKLRGEYRMRRISSFNTCIEPEKGGRL